MKLMSLNLWGATQGKVLFDYLTEQSTQVDIFCFQEVFSSQPGAPEMSSGARVFLFQELEDLLKDYTGFFDPRSSGYDFNGSVNFPISHGLAVFVKKNLKALSHKLEVIEQTSSLEDPVEGWTIAQVLMIEDKNKKFSVVNFHGVAQPGSKQDTPQRIIHSKKLRLIWEVLPSPAKILCGDFNMYPEIQSMKILESTGRNLIKEFKIQNTRNELSWKKYPGSKQTFADFTFVSPEIKVQNFEVPYNEVSDHLPMILEFEI